MNDLSKVDILALDYGGKVQLLERVGQEMINNQVEFAQVSGRYAELKANIEVLKQVKSVLQSSIKAEQPEGGAGDRSSIKRNPLYNPEA